jgi:hypothetical protein
LWSGFGEKEATTITGATCKEITDKGLVIVTKEGKKQAIEAETLVLTLPFKPNTTLLNALKGKVAETYLIGDSSGPRLIIDALAAGWRVGKTI